MNTDSRDPDVGIDLLISRRHAETVRLESSEKAAEEAWEESEKKQRIARREANRDEWVAVHHRRADRYFAWAFAELEAARRVAQMPIDGSAPRGGGIWSRYQPSPNGDGEHES
jgi:hypothetical protein